MNKPIVGITMGDPAGSGPEITIKALADPEQYSYCRPIVVGDVKVMEQAKKFVGREDIVIHRCEKVSDALFTPGTIDVLHLDLIEDISKFEIAKVSVEGGNAAFQCVKKVIELAMAGEVDATCTNALNKEAMNKALEYYHGEKSDGYTHFDGHTEIYATYTHTKKYTMMLAHHDLRVVHVSTHVSLREACDRVKKDRVLEVIEIANKACKDMGIENPRIAVAGLNPHCGENGLFGREEIEEITPAIEAAKAEGITGVVGPNGSGKSTILKTITRHLAPLAGAVELDGREISRWKTAEFARNLAVMLTDRPRTELLTCRDIVEAGRHPYTGRMGTLSPDDNSRVDEAMKTAHVEELAERDFMQISDGQRQRVMLARAIAQDPRVLVLDEPTSYLDIRYQIDLLRILRHLAKSRNVAVIMSIHELELAQKSADKVICVKDGRVFRAGAPEDIFTRETIGELYGLQHGTFNERFGSVEIGRPHGDAHTFVIAGAGTGSAVFRQLVRQGKAFYAGVLHEGDIDCELARDLAAECVAERAFEPIGDKTIARAKELLVHCARLIVCPAAFGTINARNAELVEFARSHGIEVM